MIFWSFRPFRCCLGWSIHSIVALTYCPQHSVLQCHVSGKTTPRTDVAEPPLPPPPETVQKLVYCVGVSMVWLVLDGLGLCSMSKWKIMTSIAFNQSHWIPVNVDAFWMLLNVLKGLLQRHSLIMFDYVWFNFTCSTHFIPEDSPPRSARDQPEAVKGREPSAMADTATDWSWKPYEIVWLWLNMYIWTCMNYNENKIYWKCMKMYEIDWNSMKR